MLNNWLQHSSRLAVGLVSLAALGVMRGAYVLLTVKQEIAVVCDSQLSCVAHDEVVSWCDHHSEIIHEPQKLVDAFAWARSCAVRFTRCKHAQARVMAHAPCALINDTLLLVEDGNVVHKKYYASAALPQAHVAVSEQALQQSEQLCALAQCIQKMAPQLFTEFAFMWHDITRCTITRKQDNVVVVADDQTMSNVKKINTGMRLAHKAGAAQRVVGGCVADIRFDKQVIICKRGDDEITSRC